MHTLPPIKTRGKPGVREMVHLKVNWSPPKEPQVPGEKGERATNTLQAAGFKTN